MSIRQSVGSLITGVSIILFSISVSSFTGNGVINGIYTGFMLIGAITMLVFLWEFLVKLSDNYDG